MSNWEILCEQLQHSPPSETLDPIINPIFEQMLHIPNNITNKQSVWEHTLEVVDRLYKTTTDIECLFGALVHDVGKAYTPPELLPHHYGHSERGIALLNVLENDFKLPELVKKLANDVIFYHMRVHGILEIRHPYKLYGLVKGMCNVNVDFKKLIQICSADHFSSNEYLQGKFLEQCVSIIKNEEYGELDVYKLSDAKKFSELLKLKHQEQLTKIINF